MKFLKPKQFLRSLALCFAVTYVSSQSSFAQEEGTSTGIHFGGMVGAVVSEFDNGQPHTGSRLGFAIGGFSEYKFSQLFALKLGVSYFQQGGTYVQFKDDTRFGAEDNFLNKNIKDASVTLHNVSVPLEAKLSFSDHPLVPSIVLGPYLDVNLAATETYQRSGELEGGVYGTASGQEVVTDQYEMLQYGAIAGIQFEVPTEGSGDFLIGITYKYGISPVKKAHSYIDYVEVAEDMTSNAFTFAVGYRF